MKNKKIKNKLDGFDRIMLLVEKECALYDTRRPKKKFKKIHPSGSCYMNDIMSAVQEIVAWNQGEILKVFAARLRGDFMDLSSYEIFDEIQDTITKRLEIELKELKKQ